MEPAPEAVSTEPKSTKPQPQPKGGVRSPERRAKHGRSRVANGRNILPGIDNRSVWVRRLRELLADHLVDLPDATCAEKNICRRAAVLTTELERLEVKFAINDGATDLELDLYGRTASHLRRLLESVGLQRRLKDISVITTPYAFSPLREAARIGSEP